MMRSKTSKDYDKWVQNISSKIIKELIEQLHEKTLTDITLTKGILFVLPLRKRSVGGNENGN